MKTLKSFLWPALLAITVSTACGQDTPEIKMTSLGSPTQGVAESGRAIKQIFAFEDSLYLGHGDATANTGPTDVFAFDLKKREFRKEFRCDEEMIARYRVLGGRLVIPGIDATEDWSKGNIYVKEPEGWVKHRTITNAVHVFDIAEFKGEWIAATATIDPKDKNTGSRGTVFRSADRGKTWTEWFSSPGSESRHTRAGTIAVHGERLYVFSYSYESSSGGALRFVPDAFGANDTVALGSGSAVSEDLFPDPDLAVVRSVVHFRDTLVAHACFGKNVLFGNKGEVKHRLMALDSGKFRSIKIPMDAPIRDLEACGKTLVVLSEKNVAWTQDLQTWDQRLLPRDVDPESVWIESDRLYVGTRKGFLFEGGIGK